MTTWWTYVALVLALVVSPIERQTSSRLDEADAHASTSSGKALPLAKRLSSSRPEGRPRMSPGSLVAVVEQPFAAPAPVRQSYRVTYVDNVRQSGLVLSMPHAARASPHV